jgi:hypothetical protein
MVISFIPYKNGLEGGTNFPSYLYRGEIWFVRR